MKSTSLLLLLLAVPSGAVMPLSAAYSQPADVTAPADLSDAIEDFAQGGTLHLAGGDWGVLELHDLDWPEGQPLVLRAADPANPPRFSGMVLRGIRNLEMEGLVFDYAYQPGDPLNNRPFAIFDSEGVAIRNSLFDGDEARGLGAPNDGYPTAFGLSVRGSAIVTIEESEIRNFFRGMVISQSRDIVVRANDMHGIRMDGMNFAQVEGAMIEGNHIHDFNRSIESKDHADMIQFWTASTERPSRNITIRRNLLNSGHGWFTQSIFMRNERVDKGDAGPEMYYENITIEDNFILNAHAHGITVGETRGLIIRNNTVVRNPLSEGETGRRNVYTPQIRVASAASDVEILGNVTNRIVGPEEASGWTVADNLLVQDEGRMKPGHYSRVFVGGDPADPASFAPRPGGPLDGANIGARTANLESAVN